MEYPLFNWLADHCGLQEEDAEKLAKTLNEDHKIMSIESLSNVMREYPAFLSDMHCPLAYRLQISSHLYLMTTKPLDLASSIEVLTACSNLGFSSHLCETLKRQSVSGYVLSSLPWDSIFDSSASDKCPSKYDIQKLQSVVERWKKEGIPVHLFRGVERQCLRDTAAKVRNIRL